MYCCGGMVLEIKVGADLCVRPKNGWAPTRGAPTISIFIRSVEAEFGV